MSAPDATWYPRVLVVADSAIADSSGTGITLANVYAQWPTDCLAQICGRPQRASREFADIPTVQVDKTMVPGYALARRVLGLRRRTDTTPAGPWSGAASSAISTLPPPRVRPTWQNAWLDLVPVRARSEVTRLVESFSPEVVVTLSGSIRVTALANLAAEISSAPIVPHFMDDWVSTQYRGSWVTRIPRWLLDRELERMFTHANRGLAISEAMAREYADRFVMPFLPMGNLVKVPLANPGKAGSFGLRLAYIGGLHLGRDRQLLQLARQVEKRDDWTLVVVAPRNDMRREAPEWSGLSRTELRDPIPADQVTSLAAGFDALVHVESSEQSQRRYTRLSLSTKVPQYMSVGRPILAVGPPELASIRYVEEHEIGVTAGDDVDGIRLALDLLAVPDERAVRGAAAHTQATLDFEVGRGTERLARWLRRAAN